MSHFLIFISLILCTSLAFPVGRLFNGGRLATVQPIFQSPSYRSQILRLRHDSHRDDLNDYNRKFLAIDCEMVGVRNNTISALARVSIVDYNGQIVLDKYVKPFEPVSDYRTWVSGIYPHHLKNAPSFQKVRRHVSMLLKGKILIGHAINNDLKALQLQLQFPDSMIRDTSLFGDFRKFAKGKNNAPALKVLAKQLLDLDIQSSSHDSVEDARIAMLLFQQGMEKWTDSI